ncbi:putative secreted protein (Por secretion system target) [Mesonia algae]|uniref:Putative secreted protein (Por secretion system target) n=1 Tax=Mesonia algae TaxID=213248 RepID=A0A2W7I1G8_9FLAO|nr:GEVED domain-containing protein [Mesonia algae]PZW40666.1 putative secreted protein (Por secretion system target) [Mesonia algae]
MKKITLFVCLLLASYMGWSQVYVEEDFSGGDLPTGWTNNDIEGSGQDWEFDNPGAQTINLPMSAPVAILDSDNYGTGGVQEAALETPVFDASTASAVELKFDHFFNEASFTDGLGYVEVFDGSSWVQVANYSDDTANPASESIDISDHVVGIANAQVRFRYTGSFAYWWIIDNIYVGAPPTCPAPSEVITENVTSSSVDVSWTLGGEETEWEVIYGSPGFDPETEGTTIVDNDGTLGVNILNLDSQTEYNFYVKAICAVDDESDWVGPLEFTTLAEAPINDECDNAIALAVNGDLACGEVTAGTTAGATASSQEDDVTGTPDNDVWFSFVATSEAHRISLTNVTAVIGTFTDMGMGLYNGMTGCEDLVFVDDSDPNTLNASGLTIGDTYYVRVYGWSLTNTAQTNFDICVGTTPPPPPAPINDECDNAIVLTVNEDFSCGVVTSGTTASATASSQEDDVVGTPDNDVWFSFVAASEAHRISLANVTAVIGTSIDMVIGLYNGTAGCEDLVFVDDSDPNTLNVSGLTVGDTYYVRVFGYYASSSSSFAQANFDICVGTPPPPPSNDACTGAIAISSFPYNNSQDASSATNNDGFISEGDCGSSNDGVWYTILGDGGNLTIEVTETSSWDSKVSVFTGSCGEFTCVDDVDTGNDVEVLTFASEEGTIYYVNIAYWSGFSDSPEGAFDISVTTDVVVDETVDCGQTQISNAFENGLFMEEGGQMLANDFIVSANTINFTANNITANILSQGGIASMDVIFFEDNEGLPGAEIQTFEDVIPASQDIIGEAFGFDVHEVVLDLPNAVDFAGDGANDITYWVQLVGVPTVADTQLAWESTSVNTIGNFNAFMNEEATVWTIGEDDGVFSITGQCEVADGCLLPENFMATNVTESSLDLTWVELGDAEQWTIEYGEIGFELGEGEVIIDNDGNPGITISGLMNLTSYDFYITSNCDGDDSNTVGPLTVATIDTYCQPEISFSVEPITAVTIANINNVSDAVLDASPAYEDFTDVVIELNQEGIYTITLEGNTGGNFENFFTVFVDWNQNEILDDASEVYEIGFIENSTGLDGQQASAIIEVPADAILGETRLRVYKNYSTSVIDPCAISSFGQVEDYTVNVSEANVEACEAPSDIVISEISSTSAGIIWTENGSATQWEIIYGAPGFDPEMEGTSLIDNDGDLGETINGLTAETEYDVYVRAICATGNTSDWSALQTFITSDLSIKGENFRNFSYYPNPVKNLLTLEVTGEQLEKVSVYNLLGQEVISVQPNSLKTNLNLEKLAAGPYMVMITIGGESKTIKVIKE